MSTSNFGHGSDPSVLIPGAVNPSLPTEADIRQLAGLFFGKLGSGNEPAAALQPQLVATPALPAVAGPPTSYESDLRSLPTTLRGGSTASGLGVAPQIAPAISDPGLYFLKDAFGAASGLPSGSAPSGSLVAAPDVPEIGGLAEMTGFQLPVGYEDLSRSYAVDGQLPVKIQNEYPSDPYSFSPQFVAAPGIYPTGFDVRAIRQDFPILSEKVNGKRLVWLDSAATTQKPKAVIDRLVYFYEHENSNVHRAAHTLAARATDAFEAARESVRRFLGASSSNEIVFVRGTTEGINLVAQSWGRQNIREGDEILITWLEHHANIVPWQQLCGAVGARLKVAPVDDRGQIILSEYQRLLTPATKLVAFTQVSNALGTVTPAQELIAAAHRVGAKVLLDGAQPVSHMPLDVSQLDCDWFVFSGHKVYGPTGIGAVYGKADLLNATQPWQGGGNMIQDVTFERTVYQPAPGRFEAGTGNIADAVGLGAALDYVERLGRHNVASHEHELLRYATSELSKVPGLTIIGSAAERAGVLSFVLAGHSTEAVGHALSEEGIAVRSGHHCAQPILRRFGLETSVRPSFGVYNDCDDIEALVSVLWRLQSGSPRLGL